MSQIEHPQVVSQAEWLAARKELLAKEKKFTRERDALSAERRKMPWVRVETEYVFLTPGGKQNLAGLFNGKSQLIVYHFMFGPGANPGGEPRANPLRPPAPFPWDLIVCRGESLSRVRFAGKKRRP